MLALKKTVWREKTRLTSPEFQAAATSKAWHYSGRTSFSPLQSRRTHREGLLTGWPVTCGSLYEWWYTTISHVNLSALLKSSWGFPVVPTVDLHVYALPIFTVLCQSMNFMWKGAFSWLISFVAYSWNRILRSYLMKVHSTLFYKNLPMFAISNIHTYPCKANHYELSG